MKRMIVVALGAACFGFLADVDSSSSSAAGVLTFRATLSVTSNPITCPPKWMGGGETCARRTGTGNTPGLGTVTEKYDWAFRVGPPSCPGNLSRPLATTGSLLVTSKGGLEFALTDGAPCVEMEPHLMPQDFTITGGTGAYEGASGSGHVERALSGGVGNEIWIGTLVAPNAEFDLTPPRFAGAAPKTVRAPKGAKSVRLTYKVTASDAVDGAVAVDCTPSSGSRFRVGRTLVTCSASDSSANAATAKFRVTVRPAR
jgi:hypothetical protein